MKKTYAALALATTIALAPAASAHDELTGTTPKNGTTLTSAPKSLDLTFAEKPLAVGNQISVKSPDGSTANITPSVDGSTVSAPFTSHGNGAYTVTWRVVSSDGHPISGSYGFTLKGVASSTSSASTMSSAGSSAPASPRATATTTFDAPAPAPSTQAHEDADGSSAWGVIAAAALVVVAVIAAVAFMARRRKPQ